MALGVGGRRQVVRLPVGGSILGRGIRSRFGGCCLVGAAGELRAGRLHRLRGAGPGPARHRRLRVRVQALPDLFQAGPPLLGLALAAGQIRGQVRSHAGHGLDRAAERQAVVLLPLLRAHGRLAYGHREARRPVAARISGHHTPEKLEARQLAVVAAHHDHPGRPGRQPRGRGVGGDLAAVDDHRHLVLGDRPEILGEFGEGVEDAARSCRAGRSRHHVQALEQHVLGVVDQMVALHRQARGDERRRPGRELDAETVAERASGRVRLDEQDLAALRGPAGGEMQGGGGGSWRARGAVYGQHGAGRRRARRPAAVCETMPIIGPRRARRRFPPRPERLPWPAEHRPPAGPTRPPGPRWSGRSPA